MLKILLLVIFIELLMTSCGGSLFRKTALPCQIQLKCPDETNPVYVSIHQECRIFKNRCELRNENCRRHNVYFKTLKPLSFEDCKFKCNKNMETTYECVEEEEWFCTEANGQKKSFKNDCLYKNHMCNDPTYYKKIHIGKCEDGDKSQNKGEPEEKSQNKDKENKTKKAAPDV